MEYKNLIISILLLMGIGYIYNKFRINVDKDDRANELNLIKKYLMSDKYELDINNSLDYIKKPILWLHVEYEKNSRDWESFYSRNSFELNQPYLYLTIRPIINKCSDYYHIIILDDDSFKKLLPSWDIDFKKLGNPIKDKMRHLALMKILYNYGGLYLENSFIIHKCLGKINDRVQESGKMCVAEFKNTGSDSHMLNFMPNLNFVCCKKNCETMRELVNYLEIIVSRDFTNESYVENSISKWLLEKINKNKIEYISGKFIGTKTEDNKLVTLEDLISSKNLDLTFNLYGLYIPRNELLSRTNHNWFTYLAVEEVLKSKTNIGKYLILAN